MALYEVKNVFVTSYSTQGSADGSDISDQADSFDFKSADERGETAHGGNDDWIPILDIHQSPSGSSKQSSDEVVVNYSKLQWEYEPEGQEIVDTGFDLG